MKSSNNNEESITNKRVKQNINSSSRHGTFNLISRPECHLTHWNVVSGPRLWTMSMCRNHPATWLHYFSIGIIKHRNHVQEKCEDTKYKSKSCHLQKKKKRLKTNYFQKLSEQNIKVFITQDSSTSACHCSANHSQNV